MAAATLVGFALRVVTFARPVWVLDRLFVPDDTYYTLSIARSLAHAHGPTASAHTLTSGFQPLIAFLMVPVFWFTNNPDNALRADLALLIIADTLTIVVLAWLAFRIAGHVAAVVAGVVWALSPLAIATTLGGLEASLAILCELLVVAAWMRAGDRPSVQRGVMVGILAGLAVLARVDALMLILLLGALQWWRGPRRLLVPIGAALAAVVAPWWVWSAAEFGTPLPTSGSAAHALAQVRPFSRESVAQVSAAVIGGPFAAPNKVRLFVADHTGIGIACFIAITIGLAYVGVRWLRAYAQRDDGMVAVAVLPFFAAGLLVFYAWFAFTFYFVRYLAPVATVATLIIAVVIARLVDATSRGRVYAWTLAAVTAVSGVLVLVSISADGHALVADRADRTKLDTATGYRERVLAALPLLPRHSVVGALQSGALGYYSSGSLTVINLDGVVNPDAARAMRANQTFSYMRQQHITWLAEYDFELVSFAFGAPKLLKPAPTVDHERVITPSIPSSGIAAFVIAHIEWHQQRQGP